MSIENADVRQKKAELRDHYAEGINAGVGVHDIADWVRAILRERPPRDRGYLLGVLLEEFGRMEDA